MAGGASPGFVFKPAATGEIGVGLTEVQGPNIKCKMVMVVAGPGNTGVIHVGLATGVTVDDGTTDTTTGLARTAGQDTGWMFVRNLNNLFLISDTAAQSVTYMYCT